MRIQTGFEINVWVETSYYMTERIRNYCKLSIRAFAMAGGWTAEVTCALVSVWCQANVQSELGGVVQNRMIFERISTELKEMGIHRTWQQCRMKIKKPHPEVQKGRNIIRSSNCTNTSLRSVFAFDEVYIHFYNV